VIAHAAVRVVTGQRDVGRRGAEVEQHVRLTEQQPGLVLAAVAVVATFVVDVYAASITAAIFAAAIAYYWFYSRHRIVTGSPDEEFARLALAEAELKQ
jgi:hypothetical protein